MNTMIYSKIVRTTITFIFILGAILGPPTINASAQKPKGSLSEQAGCSDPLGCVTIGTTENVHIAYALATTGPNADAGIDSRNGVEIAIDDSGGQILGHNIQFDGQDEGCSSDGGLTAGSALAADPSIVAVIGTSCSSAARTALPLLSVAGFVTVSPSNTATDLTEPGNPNHWPGYLRTAWDDRAEGIAAAQFARSVLGVSLAATINNGSLYSSSLVQAFIDEFTNLGGTITAQEMIDPGSTDMSTLLTGIAAGSPELLYFPVFMPEGGYIITQARHTSGLENVNLMGADSLHTEQVVSDTGADVEGFMVTGFDSSKFNPEYSNHFLPAYLAKFGSEPVSQFHAQAYDAFMLIKAAIEEVAVVNPDGTLVIGRQALRDSIYGTTNHYGLTGTLTCSANGNCADPHMAVFKYHVGQSWPDLIWPENVPTPRVDVRANSDQVQGFEWTIGETVTLQVGGQSIEQTVGVAPWDPNLPYVEFNLQGIYDIQPGDMVSLSNGTTTKTTTVTTLEFTSFDVDADTISGIAAPGSNMDVWACNYSDCQFVYRHVTSDGNGNWLVDFSKPGIQADEQNTINILGGTWVDSQQVDEDGDATKSGMNVPNPRFDVRVNTDLVQGWEWTEGETVTLQVGGHSIEQTVGVYYWDSSQSYVEFNLQGIYDIQPGDVVSLSNGTITKTTTVTTLEFTGFDVAADTVSGIAALGSNVDMWIDTPDQTYFRHVTADGDGNWLADFSIPGIQADEQNTFDIIPGSWGDSHQVDEDSDTTMFGMYVPDPRILAQITEDWFRATDFAPNATLIYEIYSSQGGSLLSSGTTQSDGNGFVETQVGDQVDLVPGNYLVVSDGPTTKALVLEDLKFDTFDLSNGLVLGSAPLPEGRHVWVGYGTENNYWTLDLNTDTGNTWSGNFNTPVPINFQWAAAQIFDEDGDTSEVRPTLVLGDVTIDIRPWIDPNIFLCGIPGELVPVSVLSTSGFNATTLDARNVRFGRTGTEAAVVLVGKDKKPMSYVADVNKDGLMDIVFTFRFGNTGFNCSDIPTGQHWANVNGMLTGMIGTMRVEGADVLKLYRLANQIKGD